MTARGRDPGAGDPAVSDPAPGDLAAGDPTAGDPVALVLAGGGARGAYEAGALSVLLPVLEERGQRPRILIGASVGALNAAFLASTAQLPIDEITAAALEIWEAIGWRQVARGLVSPASLLRLGEYAGEVLGVPRARIDSLLDPEPLRASLRARIDFPRIERNVREGHLDAVAVVATSASTGRSVVFHSGLASPPADVRRRIDYVSVRLTEDHVLASAAIPILFPAVHVVAPEGAQGWYMDGGTRLDTPVKPALAFGAGRVVVVALNSPAIDPRPPAGSAGSEDGGARPDALAGAAQVLVGLLEDQLAADVQTLATINRLAGPGTGKRQVPYILIAPAEPNAIAQRALDVVRTHYSGPTAAVRAPDLALLARLTGGGRDVHHAELLSFLLFAPEFARALVRLGQEDARRWLAERHDGDDLWQLGPTPPPPGPPPPPTAPDAAS